MEAYGSKRASLDAVSRATHLKTIANLTNPSPQTLEAKMRSEKRRPERASLDAASRAMRLKTNAKFHTHTPNPKP